MASAARALRRDPASAAGRCSSAATAAARPTRSTSRPNTWCATPARRRPLAAVALTTDTSLLTAAGNDLGFEQVFARQVEALCRPGDLLVLHSTSGESPNLLAAARAARDRSVTTVAFLGRGAARWRPQVDEAIVVPSEDTSRIQVIHLALEHLIVELVEAELTRGA